MPSGEIRDFREQAKPRESVRILGQNEVSGDVQRPGEAPNATPEQVDIRVHEETQKAGEAGVRVSPSDTVEISLRHGKTQQEWDTIKRGDD